MKDIFFQLFVIFGIIVFTSTKILHHKKISMKDDSRERTETDPMMEKVIQQMNGMVYSMFAGTFSDESRGPKTKWIQLPDKYDFQPNKIATNDNSFKLSSIFNWIRLPYVLELFAIMIVVFVVIAAAFCCCSWAQPKTKINIKHSIT